MSHGFDLNSPLVCEGIIGDGCGGGRIFFVEDSTLFAYDPQSQGKIELLQGLKNIMAISKKGCIISLVFEDEVRCFDLSSLQS
ncbi:thiamine biosynthesis protein ThiF [Sulfurimonas sp. SAG-AH-194-C21]|nr:thiamine biosynthesis protein ThiF [Sulfurimonas sp. SAG-AH-194-C21]MDF1882677.1 thiamine biosynthesis protein ThiF [Sulfurimonas sp. SAG-AH-194-C21]